MINQTNINFKGYDARPFQALLFRDGMCGNRGLLNLADEVSNILAKENVKVYVQESDTFVKENFREQIQLPSLFWPFAQDRITFWPNKKISAKEVSYIKMLNDGLKALKEFFGMEMTELPRHFEGGNFFFIKDGNKNSILMGKDDLIESTADIRKKVFGDNKIYYISQPDFHIDLSVRPLNNKRVLVHSPVLMLHGIQAGIDKAKKVYEETHDSEVFSVLTNLKELYKDTEIAQTQHNLKERYRILQRELKCNGFDVIPVPASVERAENRPLQNYSEYTQYNILSPENIIYDQNYINAIAYERPDHSLIYITNKSKLDKNMGITPAIEKKIEFSFEKMFKDSLKGIIREEDIHFAGGGNDFLANMLEKRGGGLHCLISEIPFLK